jgi:hypothetical protein
MSATLEQVEKTWSMVVARIERNPSFQVVPEAAMATIEDIIMCNHDEAFDEWPSASVEDKKCRVHFWKTKLLEAVGEDAASSDAGPSTSAGLWSVYFNEYIASLERDSLRTALRECGDEDYTPKSVNPAIAVFALRDAYASTAAGLDDFRATPMWA